MASVATPTEVERDIWPQFKPQSKPKSSPYGFGYTWTEAKSQWHFTIECVILDYMALVLIRTRIEYRISTSVWHPRPKTNHFLPRPNMSRF